MVTLEEFSLTVFLDVYVGKTAACIVCTFRGRCRSPLELRPSEDFGPIFLALLKYRRNKIPKIPLIMCLYSEGEYFGPSDLFLKSWWAIQSLIDSDGPALDCMPRQDNFP